MKKRIVSLVAIVVSITVFATSVFAAYPVEKDTAQSLTASAGMDLSSEDVVVWESKDPSNVYALSPAICTTSKGTVIVTCESYPNSYPTTRTGIKGMVNISTDGGHNFTKVHEGDFWFGRPFEVNGVVYIVGRSTTEAKLVILKSEDDGVTWSDAYIISEYGFHSAPTEVQIIDGYIYMTMEMQDGNAGNTMGATGRGTLVPVVLRARETSDLTEPNSWERSPNTFCYLDAVGWDGTTNKTESKGAFETIDYMGVPYCYKENYGPAAYGWLEGNLIRITDKNHVLYDEDAYYIYLRSSAMTSGYANILKIDNALNGGTMTTSLVTTPSGKTKLYTQIPGGHCKFYTTYDEESGLYWLTSNVNTDAMKSATWVKNANDGGIRLEGAQDERNKLGLYYSKNAMDWTFAGYVSRTDDETQARSYASMVIYGDDMLVVSRSGNEYAKDQHDTNQILLHRVENFRDLAKDEATSNSTLIYSPELLSDSSVKDVNTYITAAGYTLITCSFSDEKGTQSKILLEDANGYYHEKFSTTCKLGEPVKVNDILYVFGVADGELYAFTSSDNGVTWSGPISVDDSQNWYEAPTSAIVKDDKIMLALSVLDESVEAGNYMVLSRYGKVADTGSFVENSSDGSATLTGYGSVGYSAMYDLAEGESISVSFKPTTLANASAFCISFTDTVNSGSYWSSVAGGNTGSGICFELQSWQSSTNGGTLYCSTVTDNTRGTLQTISSYTGSLVNQTFTATLTRKTKVVEGEEYAWIMTVTDGNGHAYSKDILASELSSDAFKNGIYVSAGHRHPLTPDGSTYVLYKPEKKDAKQFSNIRNYTGSVGSTVYNADGTTTVTGYGAAEYNEKLSIPVGGSVSISVSPQSLLSGGNKFYVMFGNTQGSFLGTNADTENNGAAFLLSSWGNYANGAALWGGAVINGSTDIGTKDANNNDIGLLRSFAHNMLETTYTVTLTRTANAEYPWTMSVSQTKTTDVYSCQIAATQLPTDTFEKGLYISVGHTAPTSAVTASYKLSQVTVSRTGWSAISNYTGTAGSLTENAANTTFAGYGAAEYSETYKLEAGESISVDIAPQTLGTSRTYFYMTFSNKQGTSYDGNAKGGSGLAFHLQSYGSPASGASFRYGIISDGSVGSYTQIDGLGRDMTTITYTVTLTRTDSAEFPWKLTITNSYDTSAATDDIPAASLPANIFDSGLYISAGHQKPTDATIAYNLSSPVLDTQRRDTTEYDATASVNHAYMVTPVVIAASTSADLTTWSNWTYYEGRSFAEKIGNPYTNTTLQYFGIPYAYHDTSEIGWSDLKLFQIYDSDDMRGIENAYGYMTFSNAGYNYAALVRVNESTSALDYFVRTTTTKTANQNFIADEAMVFTRLPGGNNGFEIIYDSDTQVYWLITTENVDTANVTDRTQSKITVYYSYNAYDWLYCGTIAKVLGDVCVSAALDGDDIIVTAVVDGKVVTYTVADFAKNAVGDSWSVIRGADDYTVEPQKDGVILSEHGAARLNKKMDITEGTQISMKIQTTEKVSYSHVLAVGILDKNSGFVGGTGDTGNGFVIQTHLFAGNYNGFSAKYSKAVNGAIDPTTSIGGLTNDMDPADGSEAFTVKFIKREQTVDEVQYSWRIEITSSKGVTISYNVPTADVSNSLFNTSGAYLVVGSRNDKDIAYKISDVTITKPALGDINGDGTIDVRDVVLSDRKYRRSANKSYEFYERQVYDIDENGLSGFADMNLLRNNVLTNPISTNGYVDQSSTNKVRLERKHYKNASGNDMVSITLNTNFVCGGFEGIFTYDTSVLTYVTSSFEILGVASRNTAGISLQKVEEGIMSVVLGETLTGTQGDFLTLTFQVNGTAEEINWNDTAKFNMERAIYANATGSDKVVVSIHDVMLGDANEDFQINVRDIASMKKKEKAEGYSMNSDCDRDEAAVDSDDCKKLREYLCGLIEKF